MQFAAGYKETNIWEELLGIYEVEQFCRLRVAGLAPVCSPGSSGHPAACQARHRGGFGPSVATGLLGEPLILIPHLVEEGLMNLACGKSKRYQRGRAPEE